MSGTHDDAPASREASGMGSMTTGAAIAVVVNQYCSWKGIAVLADFPLAVAALAAAAAHALQVGALAFLDKVSPKKP